MKYYIFVKGGDNMKNTKLLNNSIAKIKVFLMALVIFFVNFVPFSSHVVASNNSAPRVLFISSYSYAWSSVPTQIKGLSETLGENINIDYLFMNTKNISYDEASKNLKVELNNYKNKDVVFDCVVVADDAAANFMYENRETYFKNIPVVFEGINNIDFAKELEKDPLITGISENYPLVDTIDIAKKLYPNAKQIVGITDDSIT